MFNIIDSWANFRGCAQREKLWCFDMCTENPVRDNRTWAVSNLPRKRVEQKVMEYAAEHIGECYMIDVIDPNYPDFMGNFGKWYRDPANRAKFREACLIEAAIADDTPYEMTCALRSGAFAILREAMKETKLRANLRELEEVVMSDIVDDIQSA